MQIIPVLDLKDGTVVRAQMGERDRYRPIETPLAPGGDPVDVARGLLSVHPFQTLYIADLDAIEGRGDNELAIGRLRQALPRMSLWVDNGIADPADRPLGLRARTIALCSGVKRNAIPSSFTRCRITTASFSRLTFAVRNSPAQPNCWTTPALGRAG